MNWFRLTADKSLDRPYLRVCAVHRCLVRYGVSEQWVIAKLSHVMKRKDALATLSIWKQSTDWKEREKFLFNWQK